MAGDCVVLPWVVQVRMSLVVVLVGQVRVLSCLDAFSGFSGVPQSLRVPLAHQCPWVSFGLPPSVGFGSG